MVMPFKEQVGLFKKCSWYLLCGRIAVQICVQYLSLKSLVCMESEVRLHKYLWKSFEKLMF